MTTAFLNLNGQTDGASFTAPGTTGADGVINTSGTMTFDDDTDFSAVGQTGSIYVQPAASGANYPYVTINSDTIAMIGVYRLTTTANASGMMWAGTSGGTRNWALNSTAGKLTLFNAANTIIWQSTGTLPIGTPFYIKTYANRTTGTIRAVASSLNGTTLTGLDSGTMTGQSIGAAPYGQLRWGKISTGNTTDPYWMTYLGYNDTATGLMGNYVAGTSAPTIKTGGYPVNIIGGTGGPYTATKVSGTTLAFTEDRDGSFRFTQTTSSAVYAISDGNTTTNVTIPAASTGGGGAGYTRIRVKTGGVLS